MSREPLEPVTVTTTATRESDGVAAAPTPATTSAPHELKLRERDRYAVVAEHGRGGLGRVMRAHDRDLGRDVAIKEILHRGAATEARFMREAMITARLEHPGIVPVHDAGRWPDGTPFYAMKLVSGRPLKELLREAASAAARLALLPHVTAVADAIAYAHDRGIIHRDLKPSNIIVGEFGETVVIDWGLAKDLRSSSSDGDAVEPGAISSDASVTRVGSVLGTPAYMPPEQARGEDVDARADVYALGAVLYHVLAGAAPYGGSQDQIVARVLAAPPPSLEDVAPDVPPDLAAIVKKAMAREARDRYADARTLAEDLRRFQTGQLVSAHSYSRRALAARWLRRHRVPVVVASVAIAALVVLGTVSVRRIVASGRQARAERAVAVAQRQEAEAARAQAVERANELILTQARSSLDRDPTATLAWIKAYPEDGKGAAEARRLAADAASRGVATRIFREHASYVTGAQLLPDGNTLVTLAANDALKMWRIDTGELVLSVPVRLSFYSTFLMSPDGRYVTLFESESSIAVIDTSTLNVSRLAGCTGPLPAVAISRSGTLIACQSSESTLDVIVLGSKQRKSIPWIGGGPKQILGLAFAGDDSTLLVGHADGSVSRLHEGEDGKPRQYLPPGTSGAAVVATLDDGRQVIVDHLDRTSNLWDVSGPGRPRLVRTWPALAVAISSDGSYLAVALRDGGLLLRDVRRQSERFLTREGGAIFSLAFSADGQFLASGSRDGVVAVWTLENGERSSFNGHVTGVLSLAFSSDRRFLISGGEDHSVRVWPLAPSGAQIIRSNALAVHNLASHDALGLVSWDGQDGGIRLFDVHTQTIRTLRAGATVLFGVALSPDGRQLAAGGLDGSVYLWDLATLAAERLAMPHGVLWPLMFSKNGEHLAAGTDDGTLLIWDRRGSSVRKLEGHSGLVKKIEFQPHGDWMASAGHDHVIRLWNLEDGTRKTLVGHRDSISDIAFSTDGKLLASGGWDGTARVWTLENGESKILKGHRGRVSSVDFSPDGTMLATASDLGVIFIWDLASGTHRELLGHTDQIPAIEFSPDGRYLASVSWDGTAWLWDLPSGDVSVLRGHSGDLTSLIFAASGTMLATGGEDGTVRLWKIDELKFVPSEPSAFRRWLTQSTSVPSPMSR